MLTIVIPKGEQYDAINNRFYYTKEQKIVLEHSLVSISKWESKLHVPYLSREEKTYEQTLDYIKCRTLTQNVDDSVYKSLSRENINDIAKYIENPMTATWFRDNNQPGSREILTSEVIYYYMIVLQIPFECQKWHLNRLFTLIRVCNEKNKPSKKMTQQELLAKQAQLNAARRAKLNSKG